MAASSSATLMTEGPVWKRILFFAIPLFWGNLFQQLYNTADSLIVGNFLGSSALAAVSSSGNLIFLMVGFFNGLSLGAGVVIARYFGARNQEHLQNAIHTTVTVGIFCGIFLTIVGILAAPQILILMGTPAEVLPNSISYFRIYFAGSLGFVMYNCLTGILQAVGDSKHPLLYLIISSITNIILDLFFIGILKLGVGSAALATILSQILSAVLCLIQLLRSPEEFRVNPRKLGMNRTMFLQIIRNGLPSGIQNSMISIANVFVQAHINRFGALAVAGCGAYSKLQGFAFLPVTCFTMALSTFISQNLGARKYTRAKKGSLFGILCCMLVAEFIGLILHLFAPLLVSAFDQTAEVIHYGTNFARTDSLFYFLLAFTHCMAAVFRGSGKGSSSMLVMMICWCVIRVSYITLILKIIPDIQMLFWAYPITWALSSVVFLIYYLKSDWIYGLEKQTA